MDLVHWSHTSYLPLRPASSTHSTLRAYEETSQALDKVFKEFNAAYNRVELEECNAAYNRVELEAGCAIQLSASH